MDGLAIMRNRVQAGFNQPRPDLEVSFHNLSLGEAKASNYNALIVQTRDKTYHCPKLLRRPFNDFT
jgi:hypothetical protein